MYNNPEQISPMLDKMVMGPSDEELAQMALSTSIQTILWVEEYKSSDKYHRTEMISDVSADVAAEVFKAYVFKKAFDSISGFMNRIGTKVTVNTASEFVDVNTLNSKPLYRVMTEAELNAVKKTGLLRGGREGSTYFTDANFMSADTAKSRLALPTKPEFKVEFKITNNPKVQGGNSVKPAYGEIGGGREYFTNDVVQVEIINYQKLK